MSTNRRLPAGFLALYLFLPSFVYIAGLNITYLYPLALISLLLVLNRFKVKRVHLLKSGFLVYWLYLLWVCVRSGIDSGLLYGIVTFASTVGFAYLIIVSTGTKDRLDRFIDAILSFVLTSCFLGILEALTGINVLQLIASPEWNFFTDYRMGIKRVMVQFSQPIIYGLFLMLASPLAIYRIVNSGNAKVIRRTKNIYILMCINVVLTVSRAPMFAFLLLQMIIWYMVDRNQMLFKAICGLVLLFIGLQIAGVMGFGIYDSVMRFIDMFLAIFGASSSSDVYSGVANRLEIFAWVRETVGDSIWFGKGTDAVFEYKVYEWFAKKSIENEYLNTFFHLGLVGVFAEISAFVTNVVYVLLRGRVSKTEKGKLNLLQAISITLLIYYITIASSGESSAITMHICLLSIATVYANLNNTKVLS